MKTREQILEAVKNENTYDRGNCEFLDGRDYSRLVDFFPVSDWEAFGMGLKEGADGPTPKELTKENVIACLKEDLEFAFNKARSQRGISSGLMYEVIKMWMWVLDDELQAFDEYDSYGLPLYEAVKEKYFAVAEVKNDS